MPISIAAPAKRGRESKTVEQPQSERFLTRKQLAARWAVSIETIKRKVRAGLLYPYYLGERAVRFKLSDIEAIEAQAGGAL